MSDLITLLDAAIEDDYDEFGPPSSWRFSNLGRCVRAQVLERLGHPKVPFSIKTKTLLRIGHLLERQVVKWLGSKVDILATNVTVEAPEWDAVGHADALIRVGNEINVLEVKSTRDRGVDFAPYDNHVLQASAYTIFLGLPRAFLLYLGRDGAKAVHEVRREIKTEQRIKGEWSLLGEWLRKGEAPPKRPWVQATKKVKGKEVPFVYERSGPWGNVGDPKLEPPRGSSYCAYAGTPLCCGVRDDKVLSEVQDEEADIGVCPEA